MFGNAGVGVVLLFSTSWQVLLITLMSGCLLDRLRPGFDLDVIDGLCRASASGTRGRILIHCRFAPARRRNGGLAKVWSMNWMAVFWSQRG
jgi:hypothetical protein